MTAWSHMKYAYAPKYVYGGEDKYVRDFNGGA